MLRKLLRRRPRVHHYPNASLPAGLRIYAIGDIHGCVNQLDRLHNLITDELASGRPREVLVLYLGDYVDRGPDTKGVLDRLSQPAPAGISRICLKGNHEDMITRFLNDPEEGASWCDFGGFETLLSYRIDVKSVLDRGGYEALAKELRQRLPSAHVTFLAELRASYAVGDYFFCHAGVRPGVPLEQQSPDDLMWIKQEFLANPTHHGKIIVHGHTAVEEPEIHTHRINVDTGAYATGRLTALVLEEDNRRFISA